MGERERELPQAVAADLEGIRTDLSHLKVRMGELEDRLHQLELKEELWQTPDLAGDEPVGELPS